MMETRLRAALRAFPRELSSGRETTPVRFERDDGLVAIHGESAGALEDRAIAVFEDEAIAVCRLAGLEAFVRDRAATVGPVYRPEGKGPPAAATGRVLIRLEEGQALERRRSDIEAAGYRIDRLLAYAPHAGWLTAADGNLATALSALAALRRIPDVVSVEPQLLMPSARRSAGMRSPGG